MGIQYFLVSMLFLHQFPPPSILQPSLFSQKLPPTNSSVKPPTRHVDSKFHEIRDSTRFAHYCIPQFSSVRLLTCVRLFMIPWIAARQASLSITNSWSLPKLRSIELEMPSNHFILCCPSSWQIIGVQLCLPNIFLKIKHFSKLFTH